MGRFSPDGAFASAASDRAAGDGTVRLWEMSDGLCSVSVRFGAPIAAPAAGGDAITAGLRRRLPRHHRSRLCRPAPRDLAGVVVQRWHHASPATWNRHVATVRSIAHYCPRTRILKIDRDVELQRRAEPHDHTRSIALASLERL